MPVFDFTTTRSYLVDFRFKPMFIEVLGWSSPKNIRPVSREIDGLNIDASPIAQLAGIVVFEITTSNGSLPNAKTRVLIHREISKLYHENLMIFLDKDRTQSLWYWVKREDKRVIPREHLYVKGQPGDLFLGKLSAMFVDISELDEEGNINVLQVAQRLQKALDVEKVTKKFYREYDEHRIQFLELIEGIDDEHDRRWYASVLLNRLMFIYFLQKKEFLDNGDLNYLQGRLGKSETQGKDRYYSSFLRMLFFEGFAKPEDKRSPQARQILGNIRYLNGGLFLLHPVELKWKNIFIPDRAFENLYALFDKFTWHLDDTPGGKDDEINPDVLGYIFEKYINQKSFGAYYTRPEITEYLCEQTIYRLILDAINTPGIPGVLPARHFDSVPDLLMNLDASLCRQLLFEVLPKLSLLDPACGSGAFLVAAMKTLINVYSAVTGRIEYLGDRALIAWLQKTHKEHPSLAYYIKRRIITDNLFGVDIMEEATEIARLRLFLALVASVQKLEQLEPLPNIDFNILSGNSLIGLLRVDERAFDQRYQQGNLFQKSYRQLVDGKQRQLEIYRHTTQYTEDLQFLRDEIEKSRSEAYESLNDLLLNEFSRLGIKYEEAAWDEKKGSEGKPKKRAVQLTDVKVLHPFHWGYEFDEVMNVRGGFDAIITNPPWEIFKPNAKEFFLEFSELVSKKKMRIDAFENEQARLLSDPDIRRAWLTYLNQFPYVSAFFRLAKQYENQISIIDGKKAGTDINLYKLFVEQCFNLLRPGGLCGIVVPSGIYSDLGTRRIREVLFDKTEISGLFCFENRKEIFEGVHRSFKFVVLTYEKGGKADCFPAAFMRHEVSELSVFPQQGAMWIPVELIRRLSPDSLSVMEFKSDMDIQIAEKMQAFPLLGKKSSDTWNLALGSEFHMTNDSSLFKNQPLKGCLPLYEGKMIWQFDHRYSKPRYWINEKEGRKAILGNHEDIQQILDYQKYRLGFRDVASSTNERAMICAILPKLIFVGNTINLQKNIGNDFLEDSIQLYLTSLLNSFVCDWLIRQKITSHLSLFYVYQIPMPRLTASDAGFASIVARAAKLICTTPEYDELARAVGLGSYQAGETDPVERARLRAELDGLIANLYGLTEEEFAHILSTFPLVSNPVKEEALNNFRCFSLEHNPLTYQQFDPLAQAVQVDN